MGCTNSKTIDAKETEVPANFPTGVTVARRFYCNWANATLANNVLTAEPKTEEELLEAVNWAAENGWTVRAIGIKHNWSPITIVDQGADKNLDKVLLITLMTHMNKVLEVKPAEGDQPAFARVQLGCNQIDFLTALEKAPGGNGDIGFGLTHTPAPDSITVGGMLAIDGHGTAVPSEEEAKHIDRTKATYGTYSNRMLSCRAVVFDETTQKYIIKEFKRANGNEIAPFLTHVGRSLLTEATLLVEPNYYMRCQSIMNIDWQTMFPAPVDPKAPQEKSMAWYLRHNGRAEAIWFPFTDNPWLKVWTVTDGTKPKDSRKVDGPCNYPFSDDLGPNITKYFRSFVGADDDKKDHLIKEIMAAEEARLGDKEGVKQKCFGAELLGKIESTFSEVTTGATDTAIEVFGGPRMTPVISKLVWARAATGLLTTDSDDIWGPSKNTLIYVRDTTLRVTANGYAVMTNLDNVQQCMYVFVQIYKKLIEKYAKDGKYPISCPLEIRVTGLDDPTPLGPNAVTPPLSAMGYDEEAKKNGWDCALWLDVLSLPGAEYSNEFYAEMETEILANPSYTGTNGRIRPEWSKGWGYTKDGPWRSATFVEHTRNAIPEWDATIEALDKHDQKKLFTNPWMTDFFVQRASAANKVAPPSQAPANQLPPDPAPEYAKAEGKTVPQEPSANKTPKKEAKPAAEATPKKEEPKPAAEEPKPVPENKPAEEAKPVEQAKPAEEQPKPAEEPKPVEEAKPVEPAAPAPAPATEEAKVVEPVAAA